VLAVLVACLVLDGAMSEAQARQGIIWVDLGARKFFSNSDGTVRSFRLETQDWGFQVKEVLYAIEVTGRSAATAQIGLRHDEAVEDNVNASRTQSTPIAVTTVSATLPLTLTGAATGSMLPYFFPIILADSTGAGEDWIEAKVWCGGKPF
jgi:hypothetical protein